MVEYKSIQEAMDQGEGQVAIRGWVHRERGSNKLKFIVLRDSSNTIQCVLKKDNFESNWDEIDRIQVEASMRLEGTIKKDERAPTGYELQVEKFEVVGPSDSYPITKDQSAEFLLDKRHLALRTRKLTASLKIRSTVLFALHQYIRSQGFTEAEAPTFSGEASEGGSEVFKTEYFGKTAYLTQSWQFYAENFIHAFEKVYALAPSFRAEKSMTNRHLTEFWHFEVEAAWAGLQDIMGWAEGCVGFVVRKVLEDNKTELEVLGVDLKRLEGLSFPFPRVMYKDAIELLNEKGFSMKFGDDFGAPEEKALAEHYKGFVFVTNYPLQILKFYHGEDLEHPGTGMNFNLMAPDLGEVVDGSAREPDLKKIVERLKKAEMDLGASDWYLDSRRYGSVPHAGFGLGTERLTMWICGLENVKGAIPFPRTPNRLSP